MPTTSNTQINGLLEGRASGFVRRMHNLVTPERAFDVFRQLADTYAPSLTTRHTRAPVLAALFQSAQEEGLYENAVEFEVNYLQTGVAAAKLGPPNEAKIWSISHLDNISYLTENREGDGYPLTPFCQSRQNPGSRPGVALSFDSKNGQASIIANGELVTGNRSAGGLEPAHFFKTEVRDLPLATRVCYATAAEWDRNTNMLWGCIDNAACCTAQMLATLVVAPYKPSVLVLWPDEEEGVVDTGPPSFSRAAMRLVHRTSPGMWPQLVTVSDIQDLVIAEGVDTDDPDSYGHGASMEAYASRTRGAVTPPRLLSAMRDLAKGMKEIGVIVRETGRYVNRSDDVSLVLASPNVAFLSCPGAYSHFQETPRASILDIMHLAKALAITWMAAQDPTWTARFSG